MTYFSFGVDAILSPGHEIHLGTVAKWLDVPDWVLFLHKYASGFCQLLMASLSTVTLHLFS